MKDKKYILLYKSLKEKILSGEYANNTKLPSKRVLSEMTGYSLITIENAYKMLVDEGYVYTKEKSGYFVCEVEGIRDFGSNQSERKLTLLDSQNENGEDGSFEYSLWCKTVRKVLSDKGKDLFVKSPPKGCAELRNAIAEYLLRYRGMFAQPSRIVVGSGAESLYEAAVRTIGRDKKFGIEDPCYCQIQTVYDGLGVDISKLKMAKDGIESESLSKADIDVLHVTPFHSYPSGVTATAPKRREYLHWANEKGGYIIEDDFDSEFFIPGNPIESLYSLDRYDRVIYINTFSKSLSPSFRMGYMILPEHLVETYDKVMGKYSCTVPVLEQYTLAEFIRSGHFERHLNRVRRRGTFFKKNPKNT